MSTRLHRNRAFTLIELLVALAIVAVIAGVLFPVFASARNAARRASCLSNFRNVTFATAMYLDDYNDRYMPVNHLPGVGADSRNDRTWVQLVLPYVQSFSVFHCPSDSTQRPHEDSVFDEDLVPGDTTTQYYRASLRSNAGYNYQYFAPIVRTATAWEARPIVGSSITEPGRTLVFVDSVWSLKGGVPSGGGSWLVVPPCRYTVDDGGVRRDSFTETVVGRVQVYTTSEGWGTPNDDSSLQYGGAWPWHSGRMNVGRADGGATSQTLTDLTRGCDVRPEWAGHISDRNAYIWDPR